MMRTIDPGIIGGRLYITMYWLALAWAVGVLLFAKRPDPGAERVLPRELPAGVQYYIGPYGFGESETRDVQGDREYKLATPEQIAEHFAKLERDRVYRASWLGKVESWVPVVLLAIGPFVILVAFVNWAAWVLGKKR